MITKEKLEKFAHAMKSCRILVNTPSSHGGIGDLYKKYEELKVRLEKEVDDSIFEIPSQYAEN